MDVAEGIWEMYKRLERNHRLIGMICDKFRVSDVKVDLVLAQYLAEEYRMVCAVGGEAAFNMMGPKVRPRCYYATDGFGREHGEREVENG